MGDTTFMQTSTILRGGRVIDPANGVDGVRDLCIVGGTIAASAPPGTPVVDVSGLLVCPGFVDLHVHLRDPGQTHKEDFRTGSRAAALGGFTTVVAMPNTVPPVDQAALLREVVHRAAGEACVRVLQTGALTLGRRGEVLTDAAALAEVGAAALTDDGSCIQSAGLMLEAVRRARAAGLAVIDHCEDTSISRGAAMNAGEVAKALGVSSQPTLAEEVMVARDVLISAHTGWPVHIQHISAAGSIAILRAAQKQGIPVTAEAAPHHICLTDEFCRSYGPNAKMNPPLRSEADRMAIVEALLDGAIGAIATDHAPHTAEEKAAGMEAAPFGIIGLEAAVALCANELVHRHGMDIGAFVSALTAGAARILGLKAGTLSVGVPADVTLVDLQAPHTLRTADFRSKSRNCPYEGMRCTGKVVGTMVGGAFVFSAIPGVARRL